MFSMYAAAFRHIPIRVNATAIFFFGSAGAATAPFQSVIAIQEFGLTDAAYSAVILFAAILNVVASVAIGIYSDRLGDYRLALLVVSCFGIAGSGLIYFGANTLSFLIGLLALFPVFGALNSLIFANVRAYSVTLPNNEQPGINAAVRAMISLSWVLVPGLVGMVLANSGSMLPAYLFAMAASIVCYCLFQFALPSAPVVSDQMKPKVPFLASLGRIARPSVVIRLLAISLITSMLHVNAAVLPLVTTDIAGGSLTDVGVIIGIVAALEIVFILFWGRMEPKYGSVQTIGAGSVLYAAYLVLLGQSSSPMHIYALCFISGLGAAAIISLPITYLQELIPDLAGLGSSLISVNLFVSAGFSAMFFALGTYVSDYAGTSILGGLAGLVGVALVYGLDGRRAAAKN
ncbi:MFS transporter [Labrenzia sp. OB1]|uniref:MFS transporter n=1 Tax=Labrenzia sp. OB1 TaxID=1561204 RepID=UPI0007B30586|nr:MFS transporter [Labrenzia sp. OB1]KZM50112.1 major facilitator transporter [Labrenzia sp. OB1]